MTASSEPLRLLHAVARIRARARGESSAEAATGLSFLQVTILARALKAGPLTAADLAQAEHVSQQAIAQCLAVLKARGLVRLRPDPNDRRRRLVDGTAAGQRLRDSVVEARVGWLTRAIANVVAKDERRALTVAIELLERLADADVS